MMNKLQYRTDLERLVIGSCLNGGFKECHSVLSFKNFKLEGSIKHSKFWQAMHEIAPTNPVNLVTVHLKIQEKYGVNTLQYLSMLDSAGCKENARTLALYLLEFDIRQVLNQTLNEMAIDIQDKGENRFLIDINAIRDTVNNTEIDFFDMLDSIDEYLENNKNEKLLKTLANVTNMVPRRINHIKRHNQLRNVLGFLLSEDFSPYQEKIKELIDMVENFLREKNDK